jgi:PAS domain S-box-containing protein
MKQDKHSKDIFRLLPGSIRARLLLLIAFSLLPVLGLLAWNYYQRYENRRDLTLEAELEQARGVALAFKTYVRTVWQQNYTFGQAIITFGDFNENQVAQVLTVLSGQYQSVRNMSWVNPEGLVLASSEPALIGINLSHRPYFQQIKEGALETIGNLNLRGLVTPAPTLALATAIYGVQSNFLGLVVAGIEPVHLGEVLPDQPPTSDTVYSIFDANGTLVYRKPESSLQWEDRLGWKEEDLLLRRAFETQQPQTGLTQTKYSSGKWLAAYVPIPEMGWVVCACRPLNVALAPLNKDLITDSWLAITIITGAILLALLIAHTIALPLRRLARDARLMGKGESVVSEANAQAPIEVQNLRATVKSMASGLLERTKALKESSEQLRRMVEASPFPAVIHAEDGTIVTVNAAWTHLSGYRQEDLPTVDAWTERAYGERKPQIRAYIKQLYERERMVSEGEYVIHTADGRERIWDFFTAPIGRDNQGRRLVVSTAADVTERKQVEQSLRLERAQLQSILDNAPVLISIKDLQGNMRLANRILFEHFQLPAPEDFIGRNVFDLFPREIAEQLWANDRAALEADKPLSFEESVIHKDGSWHTYLTLKFPARYLDTNELFGICAISTDITDRKHTEEVLRQNEQRLRAIFDNAGIGIVEVSEDDHFINVNERACQILKRTREELLRMNVHELTAPEDRALSDRINRRIHDGPDNRVSYEKRYLRGDGSYVWANVTISAVRDDKGHWIRSITTIEDISERKRVEEEVRRLNAELEQRVEKRTAELEAANRELESFSYSVSHDLRSPLRHIIGFIQILEEEITDSLDDKTRGHLNTISNAAKRMHELIDNLLQFSRLGRSALHPTLVDLSRLVSEIRQELASDMEGRNVEWHVEPLPSVFADPTLLRTVIVNLLGNALKYTRGRDPAVIEVGAEESETDWVCFVRDNGAGFNMEYADKLFGVFQRLHSSSEFEGTGMGLASVRRIIERHEGRIWAKGEVDRGATFYFALPRPKKI